MHWHLGSSAGTVGTLLAALLPLPGPETGREEAELSPAGGCGEGDPGLGAAPLGLCPQFPQPGPLRLLLLPAPYPGAVPAPGVGSACRSRGCRRAGKSQLQCKDEVHSVPLRGWGPWGSA